MTVIVIERTTKFKLCHRCDKRNIPVTVPNWRVLCDGCYADIKNPLPKKCLIKLNKDKKPLVI